MPLPGELLKLIDAYGDASFDCAYYSCGDDAAEYDRASHMLTVQKAELIAAIEHLKGDSE